MIVALFAAMIGKAMVALPSEEVPVAPQPVAMPEIGSIIAAENIHPIGRPGLYGLGKAPAGSRYGVVGGNLVRLNIETGELLGILRPVKKPVDEASFY